MRKPLKQQGFTLYMVLILMAVIAILVLAGGQMLNTEMRISSNDADRKYAFGLAEDALRNGEVYTYENVHKTKVLADPTIVAATQPKDFFGVIGAGKIFTNDCTNGLCAPSIEEVTNTPYVAAGNAYVGTPAWERTGTVGGKQVSVFDINNKSIEYNLGGNANVSKMPRYIVEYLGPAEDAGSILYRVTARAWGKNQNTQVTLQSVVRMPKI